MKTIAFLTVVLFWASITFGQTDPPVSRLPSQGEDIRPNWEIGVALARVNVPYLWVHEPAELNTVQFLPGLFARYDLGRWALRGGIDYTRNITHDHSWFCYDCSTERLAGTNLEVRAGAEVDFSPRKNWIFGIADLFAQRYSGSGLSTNIAWGFSQQIIGRSSKGIGCQVGLGFKWSLLKNISMGAELLAKVSYTSFRYYRVETDRSYSYDYAYQGIMFPQPLMRMYVMLRL